MRLIFNLFQRSPTIPTSQSPPPNKRIGRWLWRLAFLFMVVMSCSLAGFVMLDRYQQAQAASGSPTLNPIERLYLQNYLTNREPQLQQPAGSATVPVSFTINSGETADTIAANLASANMLNDTQLFINYLRYYGLDSQLEAGDFILSPQLTIPQLAETLTSAYAQDVELRFLEGWRSEEFVRYLAQINPAQIDAGEFAALVERRASFDLTAYDFLASLPQDTTLEGFLFPDTYRVPQDADAAYLLDAMLRNFGQRVPPAMRQQFGAQGLTLLQAVTLASIVEREAVLAEERPTIASVFYNRLAQGMKLEADPTTQYALGYQADTDSWWKTPLSLADLQVDSPYNTYVAPDLPPGPIANPGLSSLQAVASPVNSSYLFFVVDCTAVTPNTHVFSTTYEEHLANVQRCR
ncbi:MAG: endolytic transglycosylase MltG [Anaerolineales bacterium]|nr:endolytic transglycosylase MltG [Anaerolineales bacterium]